MEGLNHGLDETRVDELPMRFQGHIISVPVRIIRVLCKMAYAVVYYHEHYG